jgi:hypothetical protein
MGTAFTERDRVNSPTDGQADCDGDALRCACGSLLARYVGGHVELKCRRCKRTVLLAVQGSPRQL